MLPRVIVVDDDRLVRRLIEMALEPLDLDLVSCSSVDEAVAALQAAPARLVISDLMMPGKSGFDLLQRLREEPALAPGARVAVFSAALDDATRRQLEALGAWRLLDKPLPTRSLLHFVEEALASDANDPPADALGSDAAIAGQNFGGDLDLLARFRTDCLTQFPSDLVAAAAALQDGDLAAFRRVSHNLKGVLRLLGEHTGAAAAAAAEQAAAEGQAAQAVASWQAVRASIETLLSRRPAR